MHAVASVAVAACVTAFWSGCRDESKYCSLIPALHMCRYPQYRRRCCQSCSRHAGAPAAAAAAPFRAAAAAPRRRYAA